ncbi:RmlC-like cupin domain [Pseudocohnilembus persalinus]|uniref:RmlC-like cupin domain n=1 Tax=Pseudocohnilembus persalinus TaxID=266149 RepID=A0A0V0QDT0_PSEPJ|nr:RmlC-like cupin domain [Pseudocohnilembus persalinus]|eukprot:KRX00356.1 RmlC-like cupin domain [Pseudocohnilembus persalinus]
MQQVRNQLIQEAKNLGKLFQNQNYKTLNEVLDGSQKFQALNEFQESKKLFQNDKINGQLFGIIEENEKYFFQSGIVSYAQVMEDPNQQFSLGIFFIPKNFHMPIHDHPGMYVFQKVLFGEGESVQINLDSKPNIIKQFLYPIKQLQGDQIKNVTIQKKCLKQNDFEVITPEKNNIHGYRTSEKNFAFLDFLFPHYDFKQRYCNFYNIIEESEKQKESIIQIKGMDNDYRTRRVEIQ